jgi:hypothetical protein
MFISTNHVHIFEKTPQERPKEGRDGIKVLVVVMFDYFKQSITGAAEVPPVGKNPLSFVVARAFYTLWLCW